MGSRFRKARAGEYIRRWKERESLCGILLSRHALYYFLFAALLLGDEEVGKRFLPNACDLSFMDKVVVQQQTIYSTNYRFFSTRDGPNHLFAPNGLNCKTDNEVFLTSW